MNRRTNIIAVTVFMVAVLAIFLIPARNRERVQNGFVNLISPLLRKGADVDRTVRSYKGGTKTLRELEAENGKFKTENDGLRAENKALRGVEEENLRLKKALAYQDTSPFKLVPARVVGRSPSNWWHTIEVDKGAADGIEPLLPVLTPDGLVGRVVRVADQSSTVLLITDETCRVAGSVDGARDPEKQGIVHVEVRGDRTASRFRPRMVMRYIIDRYAARPGQMIITSGAGEGFPPGVPVGRVVEWKPQVLEGQAVLEPAVDFATLADVFIVAGMKVNARAR
jgi:rod shape-determining protein MreC